MKLFLDLLGDEGVLGDLGYKKWGGLYPKPEHCNTGLSSLYVCPLCVCKPVTASFATLLVGFVCSLDLIFHTGSHSVA